MHPFLHHLYRTASPCSEYYADLNTFNTVYERFLESKRAGADLCWQDVSPMGLEHITPSHQLPSNHDTMILSKVAVLKNSGGLGTSLGMTAGKGILEVKPGLSCIDLVATQIKHLNSAHAADVPLLMLTSFNTQNETARILEKHSGSLRFKTFSNARFPRICADTLLPLPTSVLDSDDCWSPAGHGDLYRVLSCTGLLDQLLGEGRRYLFVSNLDNIAATVDLRILKHLIDTECEFLMELTDRTEADVKGGTLVCLRGVPMLLEVAQVPDSHREEFMSADKFKIFNTNNLWIDLQAVKRIVEAGQMSLDIIANPKVISHGKAVLQLEIAAGAAVKHFHGARGINVPRSRFIPIKQTSDLMLLRSNIYALKDGRPVLTSARMLRPKPIPIIKLGDHFKKLVDFERRMPCIPDIIHLETLVVDGDVVFGQNVKLAGNVQIMAPSGRLCHIADQTRIDNSSYVNSE